jgi:hypothetical protein
MNDDEIKAAIKEAIDQLQDDLKTLIQSSTQARTEIINYANKLGHPDADKNKVDRCRKMVEKYDLRLG